MEKVIIFSHESDIDGLGSIVLGKLAFGNIDYVLSANVNVLESKFRELIENKSLYSYDKIYVTDLALYNPALDIVGKDPILSKRVLVFDHHRSAINEGCDKYSFVTIMEKDEDGNKRCGTDLFYEYLVSNGFLTKNLALDRFVLLTRLEDTWEWKNTGELGIKAHDLAILFNAIGKEKYIEKMFERLISNQDGFELTSDEKILVEDKKKEYLKLLEDIWNTAEFFNDELGNYYSAVFAEYEFRNELAEYAKSLRIKDLKYLIIVALEKGAFGQKSYRSIDEGFDVGKIAEAHGGSGHPGAASVNITEKQKEYALILRKNSKRESLNYLVTCSYDE